MCVFFCMLMTHSIKRTFDQDVVIDKSRHFADFCGFVNLKQIVVALCRYHKFDRISMSLEQVTGYLTLLLKYSTLCLKDLDENFLLCNMRYVYMYMC